jgi:hypothetical protein
VVGIDADYLHNGQVFTEYRARDAFSGREAGGNRSAESLAGEAEIGLQHRSTGESTCRRKLSGSDRRHRRRGDHQQSALEGDGADKWRTSPTGDNLLGSLGYARKISRDFTFLGRSLFDRIPLDQWRERTQLIAWRQTDVNRWNALARYEHHYDSADSSLAPGLRHDVTSSQVGELPARTWY